MFVVPKRTFRKAHDRNLLKRRMREAYRLRKAGFYEQITATGHLLSIAILYSGKKTEAFSVIEKATTKLLEMVGKRLS